MTLSSRPLDLMGLAARDRADATANAALLHHLEGAEGRRTASLARGFRADPFDPAVAEEGAAAFGALLERHPSFRGAGRPMLVGRAVGPESASDPARALGDAVQLLLGGALALQRIPNASEQHARALMNVAFGADRAGGILRRELFDAPEPDPLGELTKVLDGFDLEQLCALEIYGALSGMAGGSAGSAKPLEGAVITSVSAQRGCAGEPVVIQGRSFGSVRAPNVGVWFRAQGGGWATGTDPDPSDWRDDRIVATAPPRVGHGCVAILEFDPGVGPGAGSLAGAISDCFPAFAANAADFLDQASKPVIMSPPCVEGGPTWLAGGPPMIRSFTAVPATLAPNDALTVSWAIVGAKRAELTVEPIGGGNELGPALGGPAVPPTGTITTSALPGAFEWRAALVLRAWNDCTPSGEPVARRIEVSMVVLRPSLTVRYSAGRGFPPGEVTVQTGDPTRSVFDDTKPVVVLLHGAGGTVEDMRDPTSYRMHFENRSELRTQLIGPAWLPNFGPWGAPFPDPLLPSVIGHEPFLNASGYRTVNYSQVDNDGSVNAPTAQLVAIVRALHAALPSARLVFVAHSRGGLVLRGALKVLAGDRAVARRIRKVITLGSPHGGSALAEPGRITDRLAILLAGWEVGEQREAERLLKLLATSARDEMVPGSAKLLELANGEAALDGVTYFTVAGTSSRLFRMRQWWYTASSAIPVLSVWPELELRRFRWSREERVMLRVFEDLPLPPAELINGLGDILVANSRAGLPFASHRTFPVNHAELLWDPEVRNFVLLTLAGS